MFCHVFSFVLQCFAHHFHSEFVHKATSSKLNQTSPTMTLHHSTACQSSLARSFSSCRNLAKNCMNSFWFIVLYLSPSVTWPIMTHLTNLAPSSSPRHLDKGTLSLDGLTVMEIYHPTKGMKHRSLGGFYFLVDLVIFCTQNIAFFPANRPVRAFFRCSMSSMSSPWSGT